MTTKRLSLLVAALACSSAIPATAQTPDAPLDMSAPIATVNGEAISKADFYRQLQGYRPPASPMGDSSMEFAGAAVLKQIIQTRIVEQLAKTDGVFPTQDEVDQEFHDMSLQNDRGSTKDVDDQLALHGMAEDQFKRDTITPQLCQLNELSKGVTLTDAEITLYYTVHKSDEFTWPAATHFKRMQMANIADAQSAAAKLASGASWDDVYLSSKSDKSLPGGDFPQWLQSDLDNPQAKPLLDVIKTTDVGKFSKPFKFANGYWVIEVVAKRPKSVIPLDAVKSIVRNQLLQTKLQGAPLKVADFQAKMQTAMTSAAIVVSDPQYQPVVDQIKNPPPPPAEEAAPEPEPAPKPSTAPKPKPSKSATHKPTH